MIPSHNSTATSSNASIALSAGGIAGIIIAICVVLAIVIICVRRRSKRAANNMEAELIYSDWKQSRNKGYQASGMDEDDQESSVLFHKRSY